MEQANLSGVELSEANLTGAYFSRTDLSRANLKGANVSGVRFEETKFDAANLSFLWAWSHEPPRGLPPGTRFASCNLDPSMDLHTKPGPCPVAIAD